MSTPLSARRVQTELTEARIIAAAADLFVAQGYAATTLAAVAEHAGVGHRTVYVRFGTKAALFARVIDSGVAGDPEASEAPNGPDAATRIAQFARAGAQIMQRTGELFEVAQQAASIEASLAGNGQQGLRSTRAVHREFWQGLADDGLLSAELGGSAGADLTWLIDTTTVLGSAETFVAGRQLFGWTSQAYEQWLSTSYSRLAGIAQRS
jgi:AcrR family transcriptional regulator